MTSLLLPLTLLLSALPPPVLPVRASLAIRPGTPPASFWRELPAAQARRLGKPRYAPTSYRVFTLDLAGLKQALAPATATTGPDVLLPLPNGTQQLYRLRTSSVLAPELAARYPELRTYAGQSATAAADYVRLELTPTGLHALQVRGGRTVLIEPYRAGDTQHYICFDKAALPAGSKQAFEIPGGAAR